MEPQDGAGETPRSGRKVALIGFTIILVAIIELALVQSSSGAGGDGDNSTMTTATTLAPEIEDILGSGSGSNTAVVATPIPRLCEEGGYKYGMFFPVSAEEWTWNQGLMGFLYAVGLIYMFVGVAIYSGKYNNPMVSLLLQCVRCTLTCPPLPHPARTEVLPNPLLFLAKYLAKLKTVKHS